MLIIAFLFCSWNHTNLQLCSFFISGVKSNNFYWFSIILFSGSTYLRGTHVPKFGSFLNTEGEGSVLIQKNHCRFFGFKTVYFGRKFWKKCPQRGGGQEFNNRVLPAKNTQTNIAWKNVINVSTSFADSILQWKQVKLISVSTHCPSWMVVADPGSNK